MVGSFAGTSAEPILFDEFSDEVLLDRNSEVWFQSSDNSVSLAEVPAQNFESMESDQFHPTRDGGSYWTRITVKNTSSQAIRRYIDFLSTDMSNLVIYREIDGELRHLTSLGRRSKRAIDEKMFWFTLEQRFESNEPYTFYFQLQSVLDFSGRAYLHNSELHASFLHVGYFLSYGSVTLLMGLILYNFLLYIRLRDSAYLYYSLFMLFFNVMNATNLGMLDSYLGTDLILYSHYSPVLFLIVGFWATVYAFSFLQLSSHDKLMRKAFYVTVFCYLIGIVFELFGAQQPLFRDLLNLLSIFICIVASVRAIRRGYHPAKLFLIGYGGFLLTVVIWIMGSLGIIQRNLFVSYAAVYGGMFEAILMSLALAQRIKELDAYRVKSFIQEKQSNSLGKMVRILCHDIGNPLTVIKASTQIALANGSSSDSVAWRRVQKASNSMEAVITGARDLQAHNDGKLSLNIARVGVRKCFENVLFTFEDVARKKGVSLSVSRESDQNLFIYVDEEAFGASVLNNLTSNGLKFTKAGGQIVLSAWKEKSSIVISVKDTGIGIPKEIKDKMFDMDANVSRVGTDNEAGTGFGMPIAMNYVTSFSGTIEVESHEGGDGRESGTIFLIRLPFKASESESVK